ncbi:MAG: hypothetical protein ABRQ39_06135, partial [Candidatus Eremiobacterota bacterium]
MMGTDYKYGIEIGVDIVYRKLQILEGNFRMKKMKILLSLLLILLIFSTEKLFACDITFEPSAVKVNSNNMTSVTVTVELAHKNCPKELGDINFDYTGIKLIKKGEWK